MSFKANNYFIETLKEIDLKGQWSENPRTKWSDGTPAHYKSIFQKSFVYDISKGEFPLQTYRPTAVKGGFYDIEAIYIKQTNILEEMHPSIQPWWIDFSREEYLQMYFDTEVWSYKKPVMFDAKRRTIGQTYGHTVKRYGLVDKALYNLENNPDSRRTMINLWQEQQMIEDPLALVPCAYLTTWHIRKNKNGGNFLDFTLTQRSMDFLMTASINPAQYVEFAMMIANHLTYKTNKYHQVGIFKHDIEDIHIYDRHLKYIEELLYSTPSSVQPTIKLICEPKDFYSHTVDDFKVEGIQNIKPLSGKLEIAI